MKSIEDISNFIFVKDEPESVDIIFIPGGSHPELGEKAAELIHIGYAEYVMPCGCFSTKFGKFNGVKSKRDIYNKTYTTEFEFLKDVLVKNGVNAHQILCEDQSGTTRENAFFAKEVVVKLGLKVDKAILCCKSFHARRALMFYQLAFPETEFLVVPYDYYDGEIPVTFDTWYKTEKGIKRVLGELERISSQFTDDFMRLKEK